MLRIVSKADTAESFIQIFAHLCDRESLFIVTRSPKAIGTETKFSINLKTGEPVIRGQGKVIERFEDKDNPYGRVGMRLGFTQLDGTSRDFIDRLVAAKQTQQASQVSAAQILGTEDTEPAPTKPPRSASASGSIEVASSEKPATTPPKGEERARGSDFILPANPFGELTDNVLEAFIECSLYEDMASNSDPSIQSPNELDFKPDGPQAPPADSMGHGGRSSRPAIQSDEYTAVPPVPNLRPPPTPLATPPFPVTPPPTPAMSPPMPMDAAALATPAGLPAQSMPVPGGAPVPAMPMPGMPLHGAAMPGAPIGSASGPMPRPPTTQIDGYPVGKDPRQRQGSNWKPIAVAVLLATLVSLGVGYLLWGGSDKNRGGNDPSPATLKGDDNGTPGTPADKPDTEQAAGTAPDSDDSQGTTGQTAAGDGTGGAGGTAGNDSDGAENLAAAGAGGDDGAGGAGGDDGAGGAGGDDGAGQQVAAGAECQASIKSDPSKAVVYLGERELGATPLEVTLPCGQVELRFTRARRDDKVMTATLAPGEVNDIEADLERPMVDLVVESSPSGADVFLNGKDRGKTPVTLQVAGYRSTTLEIKKSGYKSYKKKIYPKGPRSTVDARLRKLRRR